MSASLESPSTEEPQSASMNDLINQLRESRLRAYQESPGDIKEHRRIEEVVIAGGYGYRQVLELVQNGADAILEAHEAKKTKGDPSRIEVVLADSFLYVANTGAPFTAEGIDALLRSHSSPKRGNQIGRFGLGFKSLLRLGGIIDIVTRGAAFRFDPDRCRRELKERFGVADAPGLRLAWPLDEARADTLRQRFPWATTVVCAEIKLDEFVSHLQDEMRTFPAEFLLFLPVPLTLTLDNGSGGKREVHRSRDGQEVSLHEGELVSHWRVVEQLVRITDQRARDDATHVHMRDMVPLAWAVPLHGRREEVGRFWAFFPTQTPSYVPGILNAPWKLNSDRNAVIPGEWNGALMREAAKLIAATLPRLKTDAEPGRILDAFPRQMERLDEVAAPLVEELWTHLKAAPVIPDTTGRLRQGRELWLPPRENADLARQWQALADEPQQRLLTHPSCFERQRSSRLNALAERLRRDSSVSSYISLRKREAKDWFAAVASSKGERAVKVLQLAAAFQKDCKPDEWDSIRPTLAIVPCDNKTLTTPDQAVFAPEGTCVPDGRRPVAKELSNDPDTKRILAEVLGVKELDESVWRDVLQERLKRLRLIASGDAQEEWLAFWRLLRAAPGGAVREFVRSNRRTIKVRRRDSTWDFPDHCLLPGSLVSDKDAPSNQDLLVDSEFHCADKALLDLLEVRELPEGTVEVNSPDGLHDWMCHWRHHYRDAVSDRATSIYLKPFDLTLPRGWHFLAKLTGIPNAKLTDTYLTAVVMGRFPATVKFGHSTVASYSQIDVTHPLLWLLLKHGLVRVGDEAVRLAAVMSRCHEPAVAKLLREELHPALELLKEALPSVTPAERDIRDLWRALIRSQATPEALADDGLSELWAAAAKDGVVPQMLPASGGDVPLQEIYVTGSPDLARRARSQGLVVVTLDGDSLPLWLNRGARDLASLMKLEWTQFTGPEQLLTSVLPELADVLRPDVRETARCQAAEGLKLLVGTESSPVPCLMWGYTLFLDMAQLASLSRAERFERLLAELTVVRWLEHTKDEALRILGDARVLQLREQVALAPTLEERLLRAVGGRVDPLRQVLGELGHKKFLDACEPLQLARLVLAQLGPATLKELKNALQEEGLRPPARWNTAEASAFVAGLGFPEEFASSPEAPREPEEFVSGPIELPPLHDYQHEVLEGIRSLLSSTLPRRRAVVSLPTGAGKTRVTVEAAVQMVLKPEGSRRSVLWIAQTDELCEQAVQAFRQLWLNVGAHRTDLRIVRLWGGNPNPTIQESDRPIVVVASIQILNIRMRGGDLAWLQEPGLVVVDECHHAITPSYTNLLRFLDAEAPRSGSPPKIEPPILGLSATPFRSDDEESRRLSLRFDRCWLPSDQETLHERLRRQGVLANVDHEVLETGVSLTPEELDQLGKLLPSWQGIDFEKLLEAINQRLGEIKQRNEKLVERIRHAPERSILFFANSVPHAEEMAARLSLQNIPAAAVSGKTPAASRRYFLERFQRGEIRVLCNHTVLSTGFDAPKIDMVFISRAVFSPVRYMQMVGRGLRGEKNGGKAKCRIVTVVDNLGRFGDRHPYHYCRRFFTNS